ncbi:hypothetical protein GCM10011613_04970 [Cellvibrio zantedeschiae]|uniref:VanZ-like domain-containing protein n=1 Tax=Cellvibrio zantedeschiae TaxID=1237077 RepID=A0ABQ3AUB1_9GAMM|nr:VanZ family protein [Cellvibrio zantedeschiae]GGY64221.1 hypothetical protein GCM10011613_04970 [Cellvibrio zantedeschiae]
MQRAAARKTLQKNIPMFISIRVVPVFAILFFIFILWIIVVSDSGTPNFFIDGVRNIPYGDKFGHLSLYGVLAMLVNLSLKSQQRKYFGLPFGCALVLLFALVEELTQAFFPSTRTLDIGDVFADFMGIYFAAWVSDRFSRRKHT